MGEVDCVWNRQSNSRSIPRRYNAATHKDVGNARFRLEQDRTMRRGKRAMHRIA